MHTHSENPAYFVTLRGKCGSISHGFTLIEFLVVIAIVTLAGGCNKNAPVQENNPVVAPPPSASGATATPVTPPQQPPAIAPAPGQAAPEPTLQEATDALRVWLMKRPNLPKDPNELIAQGFIKKLPTPPPGKKLAIDQQHFAVVFVDSK